MAIERIIQIFSSGLSESFKILYGPGVDDIFVNPKLVELKFEEGLYEETRRQGFDRIVFYSPHRSVFFFDAQSESLSRPGSGGNEGDYHSGRILHPGPLDDLQFFKPERPKEASQGPRGMGDVFAIRLLDTILQDQSSLRSAVIILQTETALRYFEDQRTLAALVGEWTRLPSSNPNRCFFVFSVETFPNLLDIATQLPVPELRNAVLQSSEQGKTAEFLLRIPTPEQEELRNLVLRHQQRYPLEIQEQEFDILLRRMEAESQKNRYWQGKLMGIHRLDLEAARREGWFAANLSSSSVWERLDALTGLEQVKDRVRELVNWVQIVRSRQQNKQDTADLPNLHMVFTGNPGTGKTTVARMFAEILYEIGFLKRGHLVETRADDLVADHVGGTAIKTNAIIDTALDGVLFIDEAYALTEEERGGFGQEAVETLLTRMENDRHRLVVIAAGYQEKMNRFRQSNPGLERRFPEENVLLFEDFTADQLSQILFNLLEKKNLLVTDSFRTVLHDLVLEIRRRKDENFGNAGEIRNLVEGMDRRRASRIAASDLDLNVPVTIEDIPAAYLHLLPRQMPEPESILNELDELVGLAEVKDFLRKLVLRLEYENLRYQAKTGILNRPRLQHMVFRGNPGTGKTTVARLVGRIFHAMGLLRRGHCVEVTRVDLVAGYVGQTAHKTLQKIKEALDGVLFIDEAYALLDDMSVGFGQEAIDTLVKSIEDYQNRFVVILAGYPDETNRLLASNPGLFSRFPVQLDFPDFDLDELVQILKNQLVQENYIFSEEVMQRAGEYLKQEKVRNQRFFGNARTVHSLFDQIQSRLAERVVPLARETSQDSLPGLLSTIIPADVPEPQAYIVPPSVHAHWDQNSKDSGSSNHGGFSQEKQDRD